MSFLYSTGQEDPKYIPEPLPEIQNVVMTADLGVNLPLKRLAWTVPGISFNPKGFAAAIFYMRPPKSPMLLFSSGQMVCTGCKTRDEAVLAILNLRDVLKKYGIHCAHITWKPRNVVASVKFPFKVNVESIHKSYGSYSSFEPALFPGAVFKPPGCNVTFLIFSSGNVVLTGARDEQQVYTAFNIYKEVITRARIVDSSSADSAPATIPESILEIAQNWNN